jgi:hypothetical protein
MKKEVLLAIGVGFGLGLVITFGIWTANKSLKQAKIQATPLPSPTPAIVNELPTINKLTIDSPEDESISNASSITVSGTTTPKAVVSIVYEEDETIVEADDKGAFSTKIDLIGGYNTIIISDQENTETRVVTYTTTKI